MDISILIVNFNTLTLTSECIQSIKEHTKGIEYEIILVDNGSKDGSKEYFERLQDITYIFSSENIGFGRANNLGVTHASGRYVICLNSDTRLVENSFFKMVEFFDKKGKDLSLGALGCLLIDRHGMPNRIGAELASCSDEMVNILSICPGFRNFVRLRQPAYPLEKEVFEIGYIIGADLMMRKSVFERLGGFSEVFFMYYEETDLQARMKKELGLKCMIYTGTKIIHLEGESSFKQEVHNNWKRTTYHESRNNYLKRQFPKSFWFYQWFDKAVLFLGRHNKNYSKEENKIYLKRILKTYQR